jgi:transcriptional regulator with XRE-family HTH domain
MQPDESTGLEKNQAALRCGRQALLYPVIMKMKDRLRLARLAVKMKKNRAADKIGVTPQALGQWEKGTSSPSRDHLFEAARIYRVPVGSLVDGDTPLPQPAPDELAEFKEKLLDLAEYIPEGQRGTVIKFLHAMVPEPVISRKTRQRAS